MIKRMAIIIESSNVRGLADLPGARIDAANWRSFLMSDLGGAWKDHEIFMKSKPSAGFVHELLNIYKDSYVFLAFSGHGFMEYNYSSRIYETKICLNDNEQSVLVDTISPERLGTAVFDCCRGIENAQGSIKIANESFAAGRSTSFGIAMDSANQIVLNARRSVQENISSLFLNHIEFMRTHASVRMYSCSRSESAGEDVNAGGYYTTLLIQGARNWYDEQRSKPNYAVYNTKQAHDFACEAMKEVNPLQHPEYSPFWQWYPFAIG